MLKYIFLIFFLIIYFNNPAIADLKIKGQVNAIKKGDDITRYRWSADIDSFAIKPKATLKIIFLNKNGDAVFSNQKEVIIKSGENHFRFEETCETKQWEQVSNFEVKIEYFKDPLMEQISGMDSVNSAGLEPELQQPGTEKQLSEEAIRKLMIERVEYLDQRIKEIADRLEKGEQLSELELLEFQQLLRRRDAMLEVASQIVHKCNNCPNTIIPHLK